MADLKWHLSLYVRLLGAQIDAGILTGATQRIMSALTEMLEEIRGEKAPEQRLDYKTWRQSMRTPEEES